MGTVRRAAGRVGGSVARAAWRGASRVGSIGPNSGAARRFGAFGDGSIICFPASTILNERYIRIGDATMFGPFATLSAGMVAGQQCVSDPVISIGDRCLFGRDSSIIGHFEIVIGDDVWTGPHVYITDQNHGYEDITRPISVQAMPERAVSIGAGSWLGYGTVVLPGARIGRHVTVGANSVVTGDLPDCCVAVGAPAKVVVMHDGTSWTRPPRPSVQ